MDDGSTYLDVADDHIGSRSVSDELAVGRKTDFRGLSSLGERIREKGLLYRLDSSQPSLLRISTVKAMPESKVTT